MLKVGATSAQKSIHGSSTAGWSSVQAPLSKQEADNNMSARICCPEWRSYESPQVTWLPLPGIISCQLIFNTCRLQISKLSMTLKLSLPICVWLQAKGAYIVDPYVVYPHWNPDQVILPVFSSLTALMGPYSLLFHFFSLMIVFLQLCCILLYFSSPFGESFLFSMHARALSGLSRNHLFHCWHGEYGYHGYLLQAPRRYL